MRSGKMNSIGIAASMWLVVAAPRVIGAQQPRAKVSPALHVMTVTTFDTPRHAANALIDAAERFDVYALEGLFGRYDEDIVLSGEPAQDREQAQEFAAQARKQMHVAVDPKTKSRAFVIVGEEDWPFALPIVKHGRGWSFDAAAGRDELFYRRIGSNELDAIEICHGFVEAQNDYLFFTERSGYTPAQYAQRVIASAGKQDGLAWQNPDGTWDGPIGEKIARAIDQGYKVDGEPYHGYFFKVLKGQGPAAPLGSLDYVVQGAMIGGFALVAAPAEYGETGLKTFMVSDDGVVYEKDLGPETLKAFQKMELFDPDKSWSVVTE